MLLRNYSLNPNFYKMISEKLKFYDKLDEIKTKLKRITQQRFFKYGIPFLAVIIGGSFGLKEFAQIRYQFSKKKLISPQEAEKMGITVKQPGEVTLETEFDKVKDMDVENWENKRGPRPWEENIK